MTKEELLKKYKGGFTFGEDYETIEVIPNDKDTDDNKLYLWTYDANFMPLPNISKWSQSARDKLVDKLKKRLSNLNADVWIDDLKIKEYQHEDGIKLTEREKAYHDCYKQGQFDEYAERMGYDQAEKVKAKINKQKELPVLSRW